MLKRVLSYDTGVLSISEYTTCSMQITTKKQTPGKKSWKSYNKHLVCQHFMCRSSKNSGSRHFVPLPHLMVQLSKRFLKTPLTVCARLCPSVSVALRVGLIQSFFFFLLLGLLLKLRSLVPPLPILKVSQLH